MYLGIDTSCYTSSVAVVDAQGRLAADERLPLIVKAGQRGLRQSDGVFLHMKNMPVLLEKIAPLLPEIHAVAVSKSPRREEGSYMPVFLAGEGFARAVAAARNVPLFETTHQEGHIAAVLETEHLAPEKEFIAVHLSGGTTEITLCRADENGYSTRIIGKTLDIPAGQLIDRTGVLAGLPFPCGKEMDALAAQGKVRLPVSQSGGNINFSGAETAAKRLLAQGEEHSAVFYAVFEAVAKSLEKALASLQKEYPCDTVVMAGGVSASRFIGRYLTEHLGAKIRFAQPEYATDNAVGTAYLCKRMCRN